jgi:hypothetical protein
MIYEERYSGGDRLDRDDQDSEDIARWYRNEEDGH